ncbi:MAG: hypothetical protein J7K08_06705 [Thermoplasmata archaeon]|nr:hypothetical protein [Thermoplasmata archaeon]
MKRMLISVVFLSILLSTFISGCINKSSNGSINRFESKNPLIVLYETWETGAYVVAVFKDGTVAYVYDGIPIFNNGTRKLNSKEILFVFSLTNVVEPASLPDENRYLSDYEKLNDTSFEELNNLIIASNFHSLNDSYPGNETYDSDGSDVYITLYNSNTKTVYVYDDGYHYREDLSGYIEIKRYLESMIENHWD